MYSRIESTNTSIINIYSLVHTAYYRASPVKHNTLLAFHNNTKLVWNARFLLEVHFCNKSLGSVCTGPQQWGHTLQDFWPGGIPDETVCLKTTLSHEKACEKWHRKWCYTTHEIGSKIPASHNLFCIGDWWPPETSIQSCFLLSSNTTKKKKNGLKLTETGLKICYAAARQNYLCPQVWTIYSV